MDALLEGILEIVIDAVLSLWNKFMKRKNPDYKSNRSKRLLKIIIGVLLVIFVFALFSGILFIIGLIFPNLYNMIA